MRDLSDIDLSDLVQRYESLIKEYAELSLQIAPLLDKFGKYRNELELITAEFVKRGYSPKDPESLSKMIEEEIKKKETDGQ